jgi:hypothetical protein
LNYFKTPKLDLTAEYWEVFSALPDITTNTFRPFLKKNGVNRYRLFRPQTGKLLSIKRQTNREK